MSVMNVIGSRQVFSTFTETLNLGFDQDKNKDQLVTEIKWGNGTGADQIDLHFEKGTDFAVWTLAGGASLELTLSALLDALNRTVACAKVVDFEVVVTSRTAGDYLTLGGSTTNPWTTGPWGSGTLKVFDYLCFSVRKSDSFAVNTGSSDRLKFTNSGSNPMQIKFGLKARSA